MAAADRPVFWLAAAVVFVANAMFSVTYGHWALAGLQIVTGLLAIISAAAAASGRRTSSGMGRPVTDRQHANGDPPEVR